ncbi:MAG TPA: hypothetical protein VFY71_05180 [Planctomycetota bacterium]|nr:hypothetical protein [Planctomycetota bacterium]
MSATVLCPRPAPASPAPAGSTRRASVALGRSFALLALAALAVPLRAQTYSVQRIAQDPAASSIVGTGLNDAGHVVGWAQFFGGGPTLRSWIWTPGTGVTWLAAPPGQSLLRAMDVNDSDVIAGDGGYDTGVAWRWDGAVQLLGVLPGGDTVSTAGGINEAGDIAGASRNGSSFLVPPSVFLAKPGAAMQEIYDFGTGTDINDAGQIVGYSAANIAFRYTPGVGLVPLGKLGPKDLGWPWSVNAGGDVVGEADAALQTTPKTVPFLYTDEGGMQPIGSFADHASAVSINDARMVVGNWNPIGPPPAPWMWSTSKGVTFLSTLVAPAEHLNLLEARRINNVGQILVSAVDNVTGDHLMVVLTPPGDPTWTALGFGLAGAAGVPTLSGSGSLVAGSSGAITLASAAPSSAALLFLSFALTPTPFKGGTLATVPVALMVPLATDPAGSAALAWASWPSGLPAGLDLYLQAAIADAAAVKGVALSQALHGVTP